jgi:ZIP family zinc transporter
MVELPHLAQILILSTLAGLATGTGSILVLIKKPSRKVFGFCGGFAAGVMITVSFLELILEPWKLSGPLLAILGFGAGSLFMFLDSLLPHTYFSVKEKGVMDTELFRVGFLMMIGMTVHNVPEGIAVGAGYLQSHTLGLLIAVAIALHNIPEGMAIALPIRESGASRRTAFKLALLSGVVEPVGALSAGLLLELSQGLIPLALAFAGGVMIFLTLDELVPVMHSRGHEHFTSLGIIAGCVVMLGLLGYFGI